jgi:hypothetical protein
MIRTDLKGEIKSVKDLKGRVIASNGPGSISTYEIDKILQSGGLGSPTSISRSFPSPRWVLRSTTKPVDAALRFRRSLIRSAIQASVSCLPIRTTMCGGADRLSVNMINTDWAKQNLDLVRATTSPHARRSRLRQAYPADPTARR